MRTIWAIEYVEQDNHAVGPYFSNEEDADAALISLIEVEQTRLENLAQHNYGKSASEVNYVNWTERFSQVIIVTLLDSYEEFLKYESE